MKTLLRPALALFLALTCITGVLYPLAVTVIAQTFFPRQANGSVIMHDGKAAGSQLIGQPFDNPRYFWGRLSATAPAYNASSSSGSNLGPLNADLEKNTKARIEALKKADPQNARLIPVDLVTSSGSGLDPQISPAAAEYQISRVARTRGMDENQVRRLVRQSTQGRSFGLLGEPRVNVLQLNLALDASR